MDQVDAHAAVIDSGSFFTRAGRAGEDTPAALFPSLVHRTDSGSLTVGDAVLSLRLDSSTDSQVVSPIVHGIPTDLEYCGSLWLHALEKLGVVAEETPVLLSETVACPKYTRELVCQCLFEETSVPAAYLASKDVCALYAVGRVSGLVIDVGHGVSSAVPVHEGYALPFASHRGSVGGADISDLLAYRIVQRMHQAEGMDTQMNDIATSANEIEILRTLATNAPVDVLASMRSQRRAFMQSKRSEEKGDAIDLFQEIKEKFCEFRGMDEINASALAPNPDYILPDGSKLIIGSERYLAPECIFNPYDTLGRQIPGLQYMAYMAISKCEPELRRELLQNVVLCGGTSLVKGFERRLTEELIELTPASSRIKVLSSPLNLQISVSAGLHGSGTNTAEQQAENPLAHVSRRSAHLATWVGASILASLPTFHAMWTTKAEYDESGPAVIHRKCV